MNRVLFMILVDGVSVAQNVELKDAVVFVRALFEEYYNERNMIISLKRMEAEETEDD